MEESIRCIRKRLEELSEVEYKEFNEKLLPGVERVLGVRIPILRKIAKEFAKGDFKQYLTAVNDNPESLFYHEEVILLGLVIGYAKMSREERPFFVDAFVPKISNWAICDICTMNMKFMQKDSDYWYGYLMKYKTSTKEFELRFFLVALLAHFIDACHIEEILSICNEIHCEDYYVQMGTAWLVSICYIKFPEQTLEFLKTNTMDDFTHNKSIQKIRESYRVSKREKELLNLLKRK